MKSRKVQRSLMLIEEFLENEKVKPEKEIAVETRNEIEVSQQGKKTTRF